MYMEVAPDQIYLTKRAIYIDAVNVDGLALQVMTRHGNC